MGVRGLRGSTGAVAVALAVLLSGCNQTIFNQTKIGGVDAVTTGAKQRFAFVRTADEVSRVGLIKPDKIVCAEPSPDVATAIATSFGVSASIFGKGSGALSASQAEGILQLAKRTGSIQLLRDLLYRSCESYANGAITGTTYTVLMSRIQETMVSLSLGEAALGEGGGQVGAVTSTTGADASAQVSGLGQSAEALDTALEERKAASENVAEKQKAVDDLKALQNDGDTANDPAPADVTAAEGELQDAQEALDQADGKLAEASTNFTSTRAATNAQFSGGTPSSRPDTALASVGARIQGAFLSDDYLKVVIASCLVDMSMGSKESKAAHDLRQDLVDFIDDAIVPVAAELTNAVAAARDPLVRAYSLDGLSKIMTTAEAIGQRANELATAISPVSRYSTLAEHCDTHLFKYADKMNRANRDIKLASIQNDWLAAYSAAAKQCEAFKGDNRTICLARIPEFQQPGQTSPRPIIQSQTVPEPPKP